MKKKRKWILPIAAVAAAVGALLVVALVPGEKPGAEIQAQPDGTLVIQESSLSSDRVSFIRIGEDSNIELLACIGTDGRIKVALGTCQSCNGSPRAYYTQKGSLLMCNNCGLTFPLSVLDAPGGGCHPITLDPSIVREAEGRVELSLEGLLRYEPLFEKVASH
ncbi:MAG: Fe-S-containing protein [Aristaeellaceae bacterium]